MAYTLISILGKGMYKDGYKLTKYLFPDQKTYKTKLFIEALFQCKYRDFNKLIIVGTRTSAWDMLVENTSGDIDLWSEVCDACSPNKGISDELLCKVAENASKTFNIPVILKVHTQSIDDDSTLDLLDCYSSINKDISKEDNVLFDITHGFRSMPLLLYQALQASLLNDNSKRKVEIVYGEYDRNTEISTVRSLTEYWKFSEIANATNIFKSKLDGFHLADLIEDIWLDGAKVIKRISEIVQTNFSLQLIEVSKQIKNVLKNYDPTLPSWTLNIKEILENIYNLIDNKSIAKSLYNYSKYLYNLHLNTQAIIALQVAAETAITEKAILDNYTDEDSIGNYDWWSTTGRKEFYIPARDSDRKTKKYLQNLEDFRNKVAHGGGKNGYSGFPSASNIPEIYKSALKGVENLFTYLENKQ